MKLWHFRTGGNSYRLPAIVALLAFAVPQATLQAGPPNPSLRVSVRIFERPPNYPFFDDDMNPGTAPVRVEATTEIDSIGIGQDFVVKIFVEDTRPTPQGVFAAYMDLNFDNPELATIVETLPFVEHPQNGSPTPYLHDTVNFSQFARPSSGDGLIDTDGDMIDDQIDVLGSFSSLLGGSGGGEVIYVEFAMTAAQAGTLTIEPESTAEAPAVDPEDAGESPLFDSLLFGQDESVCPTQSPPCVGTIEYVADSITIEGGDWGRIIAY